jgi:hypothetical protein
MMLADDRALVTTLVAGRTQYKRRNDDSGAMETQDERTQPRAAP